MGLELSVAVEPSETVEHFEQFLDELRPQHYSI